MISTGSESSTITLSGSAVLVNLTPPNKQPPKVKSVLKSDAHESNSQTMNKFTILFGVIGVVSSCFKHLPSNLNLILYLFHFSFGERILYVV